MSNNPFEKPVEPNPYSTSGPPVRESIPTGVMVVSIIGLILGILGLFGSCSGAAMMFASDFFANLVPDEESKEAMRKMLATQFVPVLIQSVIGLAASLLLVLASIGCLTRKPWGGNWMRMAMFVSILSTVVSLAMTLWLTLFHADTLSAPNAAQFGEQQAKQVFYASQAFSILIVVAMLGFYIFGAIYFGKQPVKDFFDRQGERLRQG